MTNSVDPDKTAHYLISRLIWIYTVCTGICFGLQAEWVNIGVCLIQENKQLLGIKGIWKHCPLIGVIIEYR